MILSFFLFHEIYSGSDGISTSPQKRNLETCEHLDQKIFRKNIIFIEIPHSVKSKIIGLALDSIINAMQHIKNRPIDSEISKGITHLHGLCFKKLDELAFNYRFINDKDVIICLNSDKIISKSNDKITSKINEVRKLKSLEYDYMAVLILELCQMYSDLYDQNCLLTSLDIYQKLTEKALSLFTNEIRDDYFIRFWKGRILKSSMFNVQDCINNEIEHYDDISKILKKNQETLEYKIYNREQL